MQLLAVIFTNLVVLCAYAAAYRRVLAESEKKDNIISALRVQLSEQIETMAVLRSQRSQEQLRRILSEAEARSLGETI